MRQIIELIWRLLHHYESEIVSNRWNSLSNCISLMQPHTYLCCKKAFVNPHKNDSLILFWQSFMRRRTIHGMMKLVMSISSWIMMDIHRIFTILVPFYTSFQRLSNGKNIIFKYSSWRRGQTNTNIIRRTLSIVAEMTS